MTYKEALKHCRKVGTAHATGDALRAMYANLIAGTHGGEALLYYEHLNKEATDDGIANVARELLRDRAKAWDILIGI